IAGHDELAGSAIIVVHRLLKGVTAQAAHDDDGRASGFAVFTGQALDELGLDPGAANLRFGSESIEHLGEVATYTMDLEARWQSETELQRLTIAETEALLDLDVNVRAQPAAVWAHLTAPALRPTWEGPIVISESAIDGRRGVGTTAQCVTGRLATLEEIVDWQPYDHIGYRLAVPDVGTIQATYDLTDTEDGTNVRLRWAAGGPLPADEPTLARIRTEKRAALDRLAIVIDPGVEAGSAGG
ncbi:MAG TPA: SRPBCC family protein, partial [Candidatus Eisenbacteria bacterium]|nr:SRPBCC family protein [Candidatus Eisenbacteria bacterium]